MSETKNFLREVPIILHEIIENKNRIWDNVVPHFKLL